MSLYTDVNFVIKLYFVFRYCSEMRRTVEGKTIKRLAANKQRSNEHFLSSVLNFSAAEENFDILYLTYRVGGYTIITPARKFLIIGYH